EIRQNLPPAPALVSFGRPIVEVPRLAAEIHHAVDGARAAHDSPARHGNAPAVEMGLRNGEETPVDGARADRRGDRRRDMDERMPVVAACLDQTNTNVRLLAQPRREHTTGRTRPDDYEIELLGGYGRHGGLESGSGGGGCELD